MKNIIFIGLIVAFLFSDWFYGLVVYCLLCLAFNWSTFGTDMHKLDSDWSKFVGSLKSRK